MPTSLHERTGAVKSGSGLRAFRVEGDADGDPRITDGIVVVVSPGAECPAGCRVVVERPSGSVLLNHDELADHDRLHLVGPVVGLLRKYPPLFAASEEAPS